MSTAGSGDGRVADSGLMGILLPRGWGWLMPDPSMLRETLESVLPPGMDADQHEQVILMAIDELLALRAGLSPWQLAAIAAWTQPADIGGEEQVLTASLVMAVQYTGRPVTVEEIAAGLAGSTLSTHVTGATTVTLAQHGPALRAETVWFPSSGGTGVRAWIYLTPVPALDALALLVLATPDEPDWESFGPLFDAMADTFVVAPEIPESVTGDS